MTLRTKLKLVGNEGERGRITNGFNKDLSVVGSVMLSSAQLSSVYLKGLAFARMCCGGAADQAGCRVSRCRSSIHKGSIKTTGSRLTDYLGTGGGDVSLGQVQVSRGEEPRCKLGRVYSMVLDDVDYRWVGVRVYLLKSM